MQDTDRSTGSICVLCSDDITVVELDEGGKTVPPALWGEGFSANPLGAGKCCLRCYIARTMPARGIPTDSMMDKLKAMQSIRHAILIRKETL